MLQAFLASQGWEFDVFICHAGSGSAFVAMLHAELLMCGLKAFVDAKSLKKEDSVQATATHAIVNSPFFVVVLSNSFKNLLHPESEVEAALAFPDVHKIIIPVFYQITVDDCLQTDNELYRKLAAIKGFPIGYKTDEQFAKSISQEVGKMAVEQLQSSKHSVPFCRVARARVHTNACTQRHARMHSLELDSLALVASARFPYDAPKLEGLWNYVASSQTLCFGFYHGQ